MTCRKGHQDCGRGDADLGKGVTDSRQDDVDCGREDTDCLGEDTGSIRWDLDCKNEDIGCKCEDTDCRREDTDYRREDTDFRREDTDFKTEHLVCKSEDPDCRRGYPGCEPEDVNCIETVTSPHNVHTPSRPCAQATRRHSDAVLTSLPLEATRRPSTATFTSLPLAPSSAIFTSLPLYSPCASQRIVFQHNGDGILTETTHKDMDRTTEHIVVDINGNDANVVKTTTEDDVDGVERTTVIRVEPLDGDPSLFCVRLTTCHYAFSLKNSCTLRRVGEFYQLESVLKWVHPYVSVPSMPLRPVLWMSSQQTKLKHLVTFLSLVLAQRQLLSNKALHLFLQTQLSMDQILENITGHRDDQVVKVEKCRSNSEGFKELFGDENGVEIERRVVEETVWK